MIGPFAVHYWALTEEPPHGIASLAVRSCASEPDCCGCCVQEPSRGHPSGASTAPAGGRSKATRKSGAKGNPQQTAAMARMALTPTRSPNRRSQSRMGNKPWQTKAFKSAVRREINVQRMRAQPFVCKSLKCDCPIASPSRAGLGIDPWHGYSWLAGCPCGRRRHPERRVTAPTRPSSAPSPRTRSTCGCGAARRRRRRCAASPPSTA